LSGSGELVEFAPPPDLPTLMRYSHANPPNVLRSLLTFTSESVGTVQVDVRGVRLLGIRVTPASEPAQPPLGPCGAAVYDFNTSERPAAVSLPPPQSRSRPICRRRASGAAAGQGSPWKSSASLTQAGRLSPAGAFQRPRRAACSRRAGSVVLAGQPARAARRLAGLQSGSRRLNGAALFRG